MMCDTHNDWHHRIECARRLIEDHLDDDLPIEEIAASAHYSMFHFHRLFRGLTGETVREYARRLRLERAAHRLAHGENTDILSIALDSGYDSHEAFSRAFKRHFGITPSAHRAGHTVTAQRQTGEFAMMTPIKVRIERSESKRIAYVRHVGPYNLVGEAWRTLMKWGWSKMMFGKPETFGLCFDDPEITPSDRLRYEACMVVGEKVKPKGDVHIKILPESIYAVALHEGALERLGDSYARLTASVACEPIDGQSWQLGDPPSLERYLADPRKVKPEDMRTEICMPVLPRRVKVRTPK